MTNFIAQGACTCGQVQFKMKAKPLFRAHCHCTNCQSFNDANYADIIVLRSRDVSLTGQESIAFENYQKPPLLKRGRCSDCSGVVIEEMNIPLIPSLTIIPAQTLHQTAEMPAPRFHMFYHRRANEIDDDLPKYSGYISSQVRFSTVLLRALMTASGHS